MYVQNVSISFTVGQCQSNDTVQCRTPVFQVLLLYLNNEQCWLFFFFQKSSIVSQLQFLVFTLHILISFACLASSVFDLCLFGIGGNGISLDQHACLCFTPAMNDTVWKSLYKMKAFADSRSTCPPSSQNRSLPFILNVSFISSSFISISTDVNIKQGRLERNLGPCEQLRKLT